MQRYWSSLRYSFLRTLFLLAADYVVSQRLQHSASPRQIARSPTVPADGSRHVRRAQALKQAQQAAGAAEVLVLPPVFLPQDSVFVGRRLRRQPTLAALGLAETDRTVSDSPSRRLATCPRGASTQASAAGRRAAAHPLLRQAAQALLRSWQHQLWWPRWPPPAPPRGGPLRSGSSPPSPRPLNRGRQEQTAWQLRQQPPGLAPR